MSVHLLVGCGTPIMCAGLKSLLEQRLDVEVSTETTEDGTVTAAKNTAPDATLVVAPVFSLENPSELGVLAALSKVILVAKAENTPRSIEALRLGVRAVLSPDCSVDDLIHVVTMVTSGDTMVMPGAARGNLGQAPEGCTSELASPCWRTSLRRGRRKCCSC